MWLPLIQSTPSDLPGLYNVPGWKVFPDTRCELTDGDLWRAHPCRIRGNPRDYARRGLGRLLTLLLLPALYALFVRSQPAVVTNQESVGPAFVAINVGRRNSMTP